MKRSLTFLALLGLLAAVSGATSFSATARSSDSFYVFNTPSKNIRCVWQSAYTRDAKRYPSNLRCDILSGLKLLPARPKYCVEGDIGQTLELGATPLAGQVKGYGRAQIGCVSDAIEPGGPLLGYGKTFSRGGISCLSTFAGLRCHNAAGHGFFLARSSYRLF